MCGGSTRLGGGATSLGSCLRLRLALGARAGVLSLALALILRRFLGPVLVELDAPLAVVRLLQPELGPERPARTAAEPGDGLRGAADRRVVTALARRAQRVH